MLQKIYNLSPIFFQNIMVSVKGVQIFKQRYNKHYKKELKELSDSKDKFKLQEKRLEEFYNYITEHSNYFSKYKRIVTKNLTLDEIELLPFMDKEIIRNNLEEIVTREKNIIRSGTGGSTGKSMKYYTHPYDISRKIAYLDYFKAKHGVYFGM